LVEINLCQRKSPTKPKKRLTTNALIAEMGFFGIPIKNSLIASARKFGLMVARITSGLVATRETIR
jgi:hypothetical protein